MKKPWLIAGLALLLALAAPASILAGPPLPPSPPELPPQWREQPWTPLCSTAWISTNNGTFPHAQAAAFCVPPGWNSTLVMYAHGYVTPFPPMIAGFEDGIPARERLALSDGIPLLLNQGHAFATTTYSQKGYAFEQVEHDLMDVLKYFNKEFGEAGRVLLVGASEGGLITTMQIERHPRIGDEGFYDGGLAMCGPVNGMPYQVAHLGNFRVLFDYFFLGVLPGSVDAIPALAYLDWDPEGDLDPLDHDLVGGIAQSILSGLGDGRTQQLFGLTGAAHTADPTTFITTAVGTLFYSIWGTNNLMDLANGNPYSTDSLFTAHPALAALDPPVEAVEADRRAENFVRHYYQTSGNLAVPLVTLHNPLDPVVPFSHETEYAARATTGMLVPLTSTPSYGHCEFTLPEFLTAFSTLDFLTTGP